MPSLLIITEHFDIGGLETYIRGQVRAMARLGWRVYMACGGEPRTELLPTEITALCPGLSLGVEATAADLLRATRTLRTFIQRHGITHVHAHPFICLFPALLAAKLEGLPYVATLHGPSSLSGGYGPLNDFLLSGVVLPHADRVVAVSEEVRALAASYMDDECLLVQPNAVDLQLFQPQSPVADGLARWLVVSRLDAFKTVGIRQFASHARTAGLPGVDIAGEGPAQAQLQEQLAQDGLAEFVRFLGVRADIPELMRASCGVAGMGRVLLEGLASGRPCCLVGYDGVKGIVDRALFDAAVTANFSGRGLPNISAEQLRAQLANHPPGSNTELHDKVANAYAESRIWQGFADGLAVLPARPAPLLAPLYSLIQSDSAQADALPYLRSDAFFYEVGRVVHGSRHFSAGLAASFDFYFQRARWLVATNELAPLIASLAEQQAHLDAQLETLLERERPVEKGPFDSWWSRLAGRWVRD
ncbi:glycosyltransferase [Bordetella sp. BOR01]|uniref:glycosyltransferase n=1 Tax=Bordetella sp. BOR01 TaxID=2854779 RepID=UPI001C45556C|nr:glycosyltransferase [Bordetella sp. BOR01]MBV7485441.1 glycosyltransferase [Bordetella sp. BOR01]